MYDLVYDRSSRCVFIIAKFETQTCCQKIGPEEGLVSLNFALRDTSNQYATFVLDFVGETKP